MNDLECEPTNKAILEECCKIMAKTEAVKIVKARSLQTRRSIEDIEELARLQKEYELS